SGGPGILEPGDRQRGHGNERGDSGFQQSAAEAGQDLSHKFQKERQGFRRDTLENTRVYECKNSSIPPHADRWALLSRRRFNTLDSPIRQDGVERRRLT